MKKARSTDTTAIGRAKTAAPDKLSYTGYGYAYYFKSLRDYSGGQLKRTDIMVFEHLLMLSEHYLKKGHVNFWHSYATLYRDTMISIDPIKDVVKKLKSLGFLSTGFTTKRGVRVTVFTLHYLKIAKNFRILFGKSDPNQPEEYRRKKQLRVQQRRVTLVRLHLQHLKLQRQLY
jgi:hypothetical protein